MRVTIRQIADMAQVSRGTVDRVIHGRYGVDPEIRSRVLGIMEEQGYTPNAMARALKGSQNPIRIGSIMPSSANLFYMDIRAGIDEASRSYEQYGVEVVKLEMECATADCLIRCIDQLEAEGVRGMMLVPIADDAVRERLNRLPDSIPVVTYNSDITGTRRLCFVGNDLLAAGRVAGQLMGLLLPERGNVLLVISQSDLLAHVERLTGFRTALNRLKPGVRCVGPEYTYEKESIAYEVVSRAISADSELAGIYVAGGGQQAAAQALADSPGAGRIRMICHDLLPKTVEFVKAGMVDFTLGQEPFLQGYMPIELLYEYHMFDRAPLTDKLLTRIDIRVRDNVDQKGYEVFTGFNARNP
ncbi:MAG: substrate-binding domain-containing protein [Clostridiales bacterium]|nr:substrate-binding domain-containing protein [Clostridiales bacterium]